MDARYDDRPALSERGERKHRNLSDPQKPVDNMMPGTGSVSTREHGTRLVGENNGLVVSNCCKQAAPPSRACATLGGADTGSQASNIRPVSAAQPYERGSGLQGLSNSSPQALFGRPNCPFHPIPCRTPVLSPAPVPCTIKRPDLAAWRRIHPRRRRSLP
jgi:hypothetical protein